MRGEPQVQRKELPNLHAGRRTAVARRCEYQRGVVTMTRLDPNLCERLAIGCQVLANEGLGDMIWGHVSVRSPEHPDIIHIKPHKMGLEEITADDIIGVNLAGERIFGGRPKHIETYIHTEIMRARPDIQSVVHVHAPSAVIFSSLDAGLQPIGHDGAMFQGSLATFRETTDLINTAARGGAVAMTLGGGDGVLLQNHGLVTAAANLEGAIIRAIFLERACRAQLQAMASGKLKYVSPETDCAAKRQAMLSDEQVLAAYAFLVRMLWRRR